MKEIGMEWNERLLYFDGRRTLMWSIYIDLELFCPVASLCALNTK